MAIPSSMKYKKDGVEFTSGVDRCCYTIRELSRAALREVGGYVVRMTTGKGRKLGGVMRAKYVQKRFQFWVRKQEGDLLVGMHNILKSKNPGATWYGMDAELGLNGQPKRAFLKNSVYENIDTIRTIEAQYLSAIEDEQRALALIDEEEVLGDGDS